MATDLPANDRESVVRARLDDRHPAELHHAWNVPSLRRRGLFAAQMQDAADVRRCDLCVLHDRNANQDDRDGRARYEGRLPIASLESTRFFHCYFWVRVSTLSFILNFQIFCLDLQN